MKVALLGAPGSGKSVFARKLARAMARDEGYSKPVIVDGYVEDLQEKTGYAFDYGSPYTQNLQLLFHRWTLEQMARLKGDSITCGTIYETFIYCAINGLIMSDLKPNDPEENIKSRTAMTTLGMLETMMYDYEAIFYLPYTKEEVEERGRSYDTVVDRKIPEVLSGYKKECVELSGSERENVRYAHKIINGIRSAQAAEAAEQPVRGSGEADSGEPEEAE